MKKLVIIDDEYFFRQALIKYIGNFKDEFTVVGDAGNGKLGIALIEQYRPEIILIDISMPQMTGFDVISYIQEQKILTHVMKATGAWEFAAKRALAQCKQFTAAQLRRALEKLAQMDFDAKQGVIQLKTDLYALLVDIYMGANKKG